MLSVLIDPADLASAGEVSGWQSEAEAMIAYLHDCPPVDPHARVFVPGELEARAREDARANGVQYDAATWGTLQALAVECGVAEPT